MKLRLAHLLFVVFFAQMALATLGMGTVMAWNLRHGFSEFMSSNDRRRLAATADIAAQQMAAAGGLDALLAQPTPMQTIMDAEADHEGIPLGERVRPPTGDSPPGAPSGPFPPNGQPGDVGLGPPPGADPPDHIVAHGGGQEFGGRVGLYAPDGRHLLGPPLPVHGRYLQAPVVFRGKPAAYVRAYSAPVPGDAERGFLKGQYGALAGLSAVLLLVTAGVAFICARWLARPLEAMGRASQAYAAGDFDQRLPPSAVREIDDTAHSLSGMAQALKSLNATRKRWLAQMSHELRTPVTVLRGELELLVHGIRFVDTAALQSLLDETLRLNRLIDDLHVLAITDAGRLRLQVSDADAVIIARRALRRIERAAQEKGLKIEAVGDWPDRVTGQWDEARLDQVLANLLNNAVAYTDAPGTVWLGLVATDASVTLTVEDSAPSFTLPVEGEDGAVGAPDHYSGGSGSGLGLRICESLVRGHGGALTIGPSWLGGVRAEVTLPRIAEVAIEAEEVAA